MTDSGRTVYGGGGITPDEKIEAPKSNHFQDELIYKDAFFHFAAHYLANRTVDKNFQVDDAVHGRLQAIPHSPEHSTGPITTSTASSDWLKVSIQAVHHYQPIRPVAGTARDGRLGPDDPEGADIPARGTGA